MTSLVNTETGELVEADVINYEIHPVAALFPFIEGSAFAEFVEDIRINGQREPVVLDAHGRLIDGRNRARACAALGVDVKETRYSGGDVEGWIISHNVHRRHLTTSQRSMIAARLATLKQGAPEGNQNAVISKGSKEPFDSSAKVERSAPSVVDAATRFNVARESVKRARSVIESGDTDLIAAVDSGEVTVTKAAQQVREASRPDTGSRSTKSRLEKAEILEDLAAQGYSSRQMCKALDYSRDDQVRELAREFNIEIPADRSVGRTRRINSTQVVENTATALEGLVMGVDLIDYEDVDPEVASQWAASLKDSLQKLQKLARFTDQIRKATQ